MKSIFLVLFVALIWIFIAGFHQPLYDVDSIILQKTLGFFQYGEIPDDYNKEEANHLQDVKELLQWLFVLMILSAVYVFAYPISAETARKAGLRLMIIAAVFVLALLFFNWSFTIFHRIFFTGDTWLFPQGSLILKMFPFIYFQKALGLIVIGWFASGILLFHLSKRMV